MILEFFADMALGLVVFVTGLLPDVSVDSVPALGPAFSMMLALDGVAPVHEALQGVLLLVAVSGLMFVFKVVQTLLAHVPGVGGGGA